VSQKYVLKICDRVPG